MIRFDLPHERPVELDVFSVAGRHVVSLVDRTLPAGTHTVRWDGRDQAGVKVAPGVYLSRLKAGDFMATRKITVAR